MHNTHPNFQRLSCRQRVKTAISFSSETVQLARWPLRRTLRQCLQLVDRPEPERFLPIVAMLEQRTLLLARSGRLVSCESRTRSLERDASACAPSGAALSVVPAQPGIVHSRIAAWDVGGPLHSLLRGADKCLALLVSHPILAIEQPWNLEFTTGSCVHNPRPYRDVYKCTKVPHTKTCLQVHGVAL